MASGHWLIETLRLLFLFGGLVLTFYLAQRSESRKRLEQIENRLRDVEGWIKNMEGRLEERRERAAEDFMDDLSQRMRGNRPGP